MESTSLIEINEHFIKQKVEFFCFECYNMFVDKLWVNKELHYHIQDIVNKKIKEGLSNIINDWKLEVNYLEIDICEKRNNIISHLIEGEEIKYIPLKFKFYYQLSKGTEIKLLEIITGY